MRRAALCVVLLAGCGGRAARPTVASGSTEFFTPIDRDVAATVRQGTQQLFAGKHADAITTLTAALSKDRANDFARYHLAVALVERGRLADAAAQLTKVLESDPVAFAARALEDKHLAPLRKFRGGFLARAVASARAAFARRAASPGLRFVARVPAGATPRSGSVEDLYQLDLSTGRYLRLTDAGAIGSIGAHAISSGGRYLAYARWRPHPYRRRELLTDLTVTVVDLATGVQTAPLPVPWDAESIRLFWDGVSFWGETRTDTDDIDDDRSDYDVDRDERWGVRRFVVDPQGSLIPERRARTPNLLMRWLSRTWGGPRADESGRAAEGVWFQGREVRLPAGRVLPLPDRGADPAVSPGGRYLAFSLQRDLCDLSPEVQTENALFLVDLKTLEMSVIARGRHLFHKTWLDDRHLVYEVGASSSAMRLRVHRVGETKDLAIGPETPVALDALPGTANCR